MTHGRLRLTACHLALAVCAWLASGAQAQAWGSIKTAGSIGDFFKRLFTDPVHQMAIAFAIPELTNNMVSLNILRDMQQTADLPPEQTASNSFKHAMTGVVTNAAGAWVTNAALYIGLANEYIRTNLIAAVASRSLGTTNSAAISNSWVSLSLALHAVQDATSPTHVGFQTWSGDEGFGDLWRHSKVERLYPKRGGQVGLRLLLEGATLWLYDIYMGRTNMPPAFFNPGGDLQIPAGYTNSATTKSAKAP